MAFIPNNTGKLTRHKGNDIYSQSTYAKPVYVRCAVVHLGRGIQRTSVRTDSSASRGNAEETTSMAKILFPNDVVIGTGDKFEIHGIALRSMNIEPRYNVHGGLDHYEVDFQVWKK